MAADPREYLNLVKNFRSGGRQASLTSHFREGLSTLLRVTHSYAPRSSSPGLSAAPAKNPRASSPTRKVTREASEEERLTAFPTLEPVAASSSPAQEPVEPVVTRGRRRSGSFRGDEAVQAASKRTAQYSAADGSHEPKSAQAVDKTPSVPQSPTRGRSRSRGHSRQRSIHGLSEPGSPVTASPEHAPLLDHLEHLTVERATQASATHAFESPRITPIQETPHPTATYSYSPHRNMPPRGTTKPGRAKLGPNSEPKEWLQAALRNQYLPEPIMKALCEKAKELMMEESNVQYVSTPVTICGDLHGQFYDVLELFRVAGGVPTDEEVTEASPASKGVISSEDIEPPTEITDPKLKKKMRNLSVRDDNAASSSVDDEDDADEEQRGRSRGPVNTASLGELKEGNTDIPGNQNYIFLGDFVDRGYYSLETLTLLLCLKVLYPARVTLVRGNHESRQITQVYGFYEECNQKYGNASVWKACCQVFDFLVLGAIVDGKVLCVHGGLSPEIRTLDQIRVIARAQEIPHEGAFCDLVWSDPEDIGTWAISPRGAGWLFGDKVALEFNHVNGFDLIARAHQLVNEGYKWHFEQKSVVTVWSAPNYCYRCGNVASIMNLGEDLKPSFKIFSAVPEEKRQVPVATGRRNDYFL